MKKLLFIILSILLTASTMFGWGMITVGGGVESSVGGCTIQTDIEDGTNSTGYDIGKNSATICVASKFEAGTTHDICSADLKLMKNGSPTFNFTYSIYSNACTICDRSDDQPNLIIGDQSDSYAASAVPTDVDPAYTSVSGFTASVTAGSIYWGVITTSASQDISNDIEWISADGDSTPSLQELIMSSTVGCASWSQLTAIRTEKFKHYKE